MPPPDFHLDHTLSDWPACCIEVRGSCSPRLAHGGTQPGHRRRLALGTALRVVVLAGGLACGLGAFVASASKSLVIVGRTTANTCGSYSLALWRYFHARGIILRLRAAGRRVQFPHQFPDADTSPEVYLPDPALHVLVVALPGADRRARPGSHGRAAAKLGRATGAGARVAPRPFGAKRRGGGSPGATSQRSDARVARLATRELVTS